MTDRKKNITRNAHRHNGLFEIHFPSRENYQNGQKWGDEAF